MHVASKHVQRVPLAEQIRDPLGHEQIRVKAYLMYP